MRGWPLGVLLVALAARLWGVGWQLPAALYFDEMKYVEWARRALDGGPRLVSDLRNPTVYHHLLHAEYWLAALVRSGGTPAESAVFQLGLARITSAVLGALACVLTGLAAARLVDHVGSIGRTDGPRSVPAVARPAPRGAVRGSERGALVGLVAGLTLAIAPLHVHLSHYALNDAPATFFLAATLWLGTRALAGGRTDLVLAGLLAGLAFTTKYNVGVALLLPLAAALLFPPARAADGPPSGGDTNAAPADSAGAAPDGQPTRTVEAPTSAPATGAASEDVPTPGRPAAAPLARPAGRADARQSKLGTRLGWLAIVGAAFVLGALAGMPELTGDPRGVLAGVAEQARLGGLRWSGQSGAPIWALYAETLGHGLGRSVLVAALAGAIWLGRRNRAALLAQLVVPGGCLLVMLRQELFFARFALPLLPSLAVLAGLGLVWLAEGVARRLLAPRAVPSTSRLGVRPAHVFGAALLGLLLLALLPPLATTIAHNRLATTTDTRVLASRWLDQHAPGSKVATDSYGVPIAWSGNRGPRPYKLERSNKLVEAAEVGRLACDGTRFFLVASLTSEREIERRGRGPQGTGYELLARSGRVVVEFSPLKPGQWAPAHPDNTGIPFWFLDAYARPGPKVTIYEMTPSTAACLPPRRQ